MKNLIFRVDGNKEIGLGHVYRCFAIAKRFEKEIKAVFLTNNSESIKSLLFQNSLDATVVAIGNEKEQLIELFSHNKTIIVDKYYINKDYFKELKKIGFETIYLDDLIVNFGGIDHIINHNPIVSLDNYSTRMKQDTTFHLGFDFLLLRNEFLLEVTTSLVERNLNDVFIAAGGTDAKNVLSSLINNVLESEMVNNIHVLSNKPLPEFKDHRKIKWHFNLSANELISLLKQCKVAITSASSISLECSCVGISLLTFYIAENQVELDVFMNQTGLSKSLGEWKNQSLKKELNHCLLNYKEALVIQKDYMGKFDFNKLGMLFN